MSALSKDARIIVQTELISGEYLCESYSGIPADNSCLIFITTAGNPNVTVWAEALRQEISASILGLTENIIKVNDSCSGRIRNPLECEAHRDNACQKLLVLVGDPVNPLPASTFLSGLLSSGSSYMLLPVFPVSAPVDTLLPPDFSNLNAALWRRSIREVVPVIFSTVGLTTRDYRVFISYTRRNNPSLSEQLFDALTRENFDVYLDRFRMPPGIDFKVRIEQELNDKSMVLIIETSAIMESSWCQFEINFAKRHRLGLLALQVPGGPSVPGIDPRARLKLENSDFENRYTLAHLRPLALENVLRCIKFEHGRALLRRRQFMRDVMSTALSLCGLPGASPSPDGLIHVQTECNGVQKNYAISLSARSPDLPDFQVTDVSLSPNEQGIILAPAVVEANREARIRWLESKSKIQCFDEGYILKTAVDIAQGIL